MWTYFINSIAGEYDNEIQVARSTGYIQQQQDRHDDYQQDHQQVTMMQQDQRAAMQQQQQTADPALLGPVQD